MKESGVTMTRQPSDLEAIVSDLATITDQARWAWTHGMWPPGRGLDPERGASLRPRSAEELEDPDFVHGDLYETGLGEWRTRQAYKGAIRAVSIADVSLYGVVYYSRVRVQPGLVKLDEWSDAPQLARCAEVARERARLLVGEPLHAEDNRLLKHARTELDRAIRALSAALDAGSTLGIAHNEDEQLDRGIPAEMRCRVCKLRKRRAKNTRCETCHSWWRRHGKQEERDPRLDGIHPIDAQRKRKERGLGWGAA